MRTVTEQQKKDFREKQKQFTLTFSGGKVLTNDDIVLDSMSITRTLCDSEQLAFNTVYASEFNIQIFNDGTRYDGQTVNVKMTAESYTIDLGTYTVASNARSNDRLYRSLVAYDKIAEILSTNYSDWHNDLKSNPPTTIGAYRNAFFSHVGITQASTVLCNDSTAFKFTETTGALSGATILGELCAINGTFGYLDFNQTFKWVTPILDADGGLYPSITLYPSNTLYPMDAETAMGESGIDSYSVDKDNYDIGGLACEEFVTQKITQVYMHMDDVVYASGTVGNRLTFTNTLFTMEPNIAVQAVANIRATVGDFCYTPTSVSMLATPWLELCDVVAAEVSDTEKVYFPVLNFTMRGTGAIRQTIEAKGVRVNSDEATSADYKIITASNAADYAADLARQAQQAANAAQESADTAQESAETAQQTADDAQTAADTAQTTADNAQTAADTAQTTADNAQTAADTAQETAETAQTTADEAKATFGTCSTGAGTADKVVACENFKLEEGAVIEVLFTYGNTAQEPTLNINDTGAVPIYVNGVAPSTLTNPAEWVDNTYINFVYDGTAFNIIDAPSTYTSYCSAASGTAQKSIIDLENAIIMNGAVLNVTFENGEDSALALTLSIIGAPRGCMFEDTAVGSTNPFTWNSGSKITFTLTDGLWVITDSGATRKAIEAGKTATNYLHFSNNKGLVVSQTPVETDAQIEALATPNSRVVSDGFDVYKNGTTRVAHFGEQTAIGENGKSQLTLDSTSLNFNAATGTSRFTIANSVIGHGSSQERYIEVSEDREYINEDGTLNEDTLASLIAEKVSQRQMTSAPYDYVIAATTSNCTMVMRLFGYAFDSTLRTTGDYSSSELLEFSISLSNGVLTATCSESAESDWTDFVSEFAAKFPTGATEHMLWLTFTLNYPISDVQMTLGSRKSESRIGARSVCIGNDNTASGTGSVAIGKGLTVTDDYSVIVGENNIVMEDGMGNHMPTAFAVGANGTTPFAVLKNGIMVMSSANSGRAPDIQYAANSRTDVRIDFQHEYPNTPFIFLTLFEDNIPANRVSDYASVQIYLKAVDVTGFTATVVNGGANPHTFSFNWFAISIM